MSKRSTKHLYPGFSNDEFDLIEAVLMLDHNFISDSQHKVFMKQALAEVIKERKRPGHVVSFSTQSVLAMFAALVDCQDAVMDAAKSNAFKGSHWTRQLYPKLVKKLRHQLLNGVIVPSPGRLPRFVKRLKQIAKHDPRKALDEATRHVGLDSRNNQITAATGMDACLIGGLRKTVGHRFIDPIKLALHDPSLKQNHKLYRALKRQQAKGRKYVVIKIHGKSVYAGPVTSKRACAGLDRSLDVEKEQRKVIKNA